MNEIEIETFNQSLFLRVNADVGKPVWSVDSAIVIANDLNYLIQALLLVLWLWGDEAKRKQHPRLFMIGLDHALIPHVADSSFPSDHMTVFVGVGLTLLLDGALWFGLATLIVGLIIAWARVLLGVYFPLDMLGAVGASTCSYFIASPFCLGAAGNGGDESGLFLVGVPVRQTLRPHEPQDTAGTRPGHPDCGRPGVGDQ